MCVPAQLEVEFESLAELEQFWAAIPPELHRAWSQRAQARLPCRHFSQHWYTAVAGTTGLQRC